MSLRPRYLLHTLVRVAMATCAYSSVFTATPSPWTLLYLAAACFWTFQSVSALRQVLGHVPTPRPPRTARRPPLRESRMLNIKEGGLYVTRDLQTLVEVTEHRPSYESYPFVGVLKNSATHAPGLTITYTKDGFQYGAHHETPLDLLEEFIVPANMWQPGMRTRATAKPWREVYTLGSLHVTRCHERLVSVIEVVDPSPTEHCVKVKVVGAAIGLAEGQLGVGQEFLVTRKGRFNPPEVEDLDLTDVWAASLATWRPASNRTHVTIPLTSEPTGQLVPFSGEPQVDHLYRNRHGDKLIRIMRCASGGTWPYEGRVAVGEQFASGGEGSWTLKGEYNPPKVSPNDLTHEWTGTEQGYQDWTRARERAELEGRTYRAQADARVRTTGHLDRAMAQAQELMGSMGMSFDLGGRTGRLVEKEPKVTVTPSSPPPVQWDDIIGQEEAKSLMRDAIEAQSTHADIYAHFGMPQAKGVLLYGPPGCGKTMLGKAAAGALASIHGKPYKDGFIYRNGAQMMGPGWMDETNFFKHAFDEAEKFHRDHGYPAVVFFDECDACLPPRERTSMFHRNAVNLFLTRMDGIEARTCFVILATNHLEMLDEAAIRPGRVDKRIYVGHPSKEDVKALFQTYLGKLLLKPGEERDTLVTAAHAELFHEKYALEDYEWTQKLTGAMLAGIADEARRLAFRRACRVKSETGAFDPAEAGVTLEDVLSGVRGLYAEQKVMLERRRKDPNNPENWVRRTEKLADKAMDRLERLRDGTPPPDDLEDLMNGKGGVS